MLFERETVTPHGRLAAMEELFARVAKRRDTAHEPGHVPVETLEAFGDLETPLRYMLEAASAGCKDRARLSQLRKVEKCLNNLPEALMTSLSAGPDENWLCLFRHLLQLHTLLTDCRNEHSKLQTEIQGLLGKYHDDGKDPNPIAKGMSWMKTNMKLSMEDCDSTIADLITDGCNMGVKSLNRYLNQYKAADEVSKDITKRLINLEEQLTIDIRAYL